MATIGRTSIGSGPRAVNQSAKGLRVTMTEAGAAGVSIWAYVEDTSGAGDGFAGAIMAGANNGTVLATSAVRTDIGTAGWVQFTGGGLSTFTPANGVAYILVLASLSVAGAGIYNDDIGLEAFAAGSGVSSLTPLTFGGTAILSADLVRDYSLYMEYTPAGGGGSGRVPFIRP